MADYLIKGQTLTDIADAIRAKRGSTEQIEADEMATQIREISSGSGGSGDLETVTVTVKITLINSYYTNENGDSVNRTIVGTSTSPTSINCVKNSILLFSVDTPPAISGGTVCLNTGSYRAIVLTGDITVGTISPK